MSIIHKLDLTEYVSHFEKFFARPKSIILEGDVKTNYAYIQEFSQAQLNSTPEVKNLDKQLMHLSKSGVLSIDDIYTFVQIVRYVKHLKYTIKSPKLSTLLTKIDIPEDIEQVVGYFDSKGKLLSSIDERFAQNAHHLAKTKEAIHETLKRMLSTKKIQPYLVDRQVHFVNEVESLLVRGGFNHVMRATVIGRSSGGFFYVTPQSIESLRKDESRLLSEYEALVYEYAQKISSLLNKWLTFLTFLNKEFDRLDHFQARAAFAKAKDYEFCLPSSSKEMVLKNFSHPALHNPKPISLDFRKKLLMLTGVNAGGKTMAMKSILSASYMAKYLLPMSIDANNSQIVTFKEIIPIIDDPQNVKNDISTFAGRMVEFSTLFRKNNFIVGVDEIELGTDSDEAASLFKVILDKLMEKDVKIIITTHHKKLAALMAKEEECELSAAIYDLKTQRPKYAFLSGTIGKSYAFETAERYGIPRNIIDYAREVYGKDTEKLGDLIQKNIDLEMKLREKEERLERNFKELNTLKQETRKEKEDLRDAFLKEQSAYESKYKEAIKIAQDAVKKSHTREIHKALNKAHDVKKSIQTNTVCEPETLQKGDRIRYHNTKGVILSIKKEEAYIENDDGRKMRVPLCDIFKVPIQKKLKKKSLKQQSYVRPAHASIKLDLHGMRREEALEKLDVFISDALLSGFDEILVYHGIGAGILAKSVREVLKTHPSIKSYTDAPANLGGFGATIIKL